MYIVRGYQGRVDDVQGLADPEPGSGAARYLHPHLRRWINDGKLRADLRPGRYGQQYLTQGVGPLGALLGGVLGEAIGLRGTVIVAGTGTLFAFAWVLVSPVRSLGDLHPDTYFA